MMKRERLIGRFQIGRETAFVADIGAVAGSFSTFLSAWKISAPKRRPSLKVGAPTGMIMNSWKSIGLSACAPPLMMFIIGTGSTCAFGPAEIAIERKARRRRGGLRDGERDAEDRVRAEPALVRRAVERAHHADRCGPVLRRPCRRGVENFAVDGIDRLADALAAIALAAVAQLVGFVLARRRARRHRGAPEAAALQFDIDFDRGIAAAVENFARDDVDDGCHALTNFGLIGSTVVRAPPSSRTRPVSQNPL